MYRVRFFSTRGGHLGTVDTDAVPTLYSQASVSGYTGTVEWVTILVYGGKLMYDVVISQ